MYDFVYVVVMRVLISWYGHLLMSGFCAGEGQLDLGRIWRLLAVVLGDGMDGSVIDDGGFCREAMARS